MELMTLSHGIASVDKFHQLAIEAGFEEDFLLHFGRKILPSTNMEDIEFWIGLVQRKLSAAFHRESVTMDEQTFRDEVSPVICEISFHLFVQMLEESQDARLLQLQLIGV